MRQLPSRPVKRSEEDRQLLPKSSLQKLVQQVGVHYQVLAWTSIQGSSLASIVVIHCLREGHRACLPFCFVKAIAGIPVVASGHKGLVQEGVHMIWMWVLRLCI